MISDEKRFLPRWETHNRILLQEESTLAVWEALTDDLSCRGACISLNSHPITPGQKIKATIFLENAAVIGISGNIVWLKTTTNERRAGILFSNMSTKCQEKILEYALTFKKNSVVNHWFTGWGGQNNVAG